MAYIEKRADRKKPYRVRYRAPDNSLRSRTFTRKSDAEKFVSVIETDKVRGAWVDPRLSQTTFAEWTARWLDTMADLKPKTLAGYDSLLRTHVLPEFGSLGLAAIEPLHIRKWIARLRKGGLSVSRTRQAYQVLSAALKAAVESDYLARTPCIGVKLPREQRQEMRFLNARQVADLVAATPDPYKVAVYVLAYGGLRWGELVALRRRRCDLLRSRLIVAESASAVSGRLYFGPTKTYQARSVVVPPFLRDLLAEHLQNNVDADLDAFVFTAPKGGPLDHSWFSKRIWHVAVRHTGLPEGLRIHDMRHTCAALLISQEPNAKKIQAHLGHSSITVTFDRYGHLFPDDMEQLAMGLETLWRAAHSQSTNSPNAPQELPRGNERATQ